METKKITYNAFFGLSQRIGESRLIFDRKDGPDLPLASVDDEGARPMAVDQKLLDAWRNGDVPQAVITDTHRNFEDLLPIEAIEKKLELSRTIMSLLKLYSDHSEANRVGDIEKVSKSSTELFRTGVKALDQLEVVMMRIESKMDSGDYDAIVMGNYVDDIFDLTKEIKGVRVLLGHDMQVRLKAFRDRLKIYSKKLTLTQK